jgi:AraC-like DNA-binding protein
MGLAVFNGPGAAASRHRHDAVQIIACAAREVAVVFDDAVVEGHVVVVSSRLPHRVERVGEWVAVVLVEPSVFGPRALDTSPRVVAFGDADLVASLVGSASAPVEAATILARGARLAEVVGGRRRAEFGGRLRPEVARSIELVEAMADGVPRLDDIAAEVALSSSRLSRVFAQEVGFPFRRYVLWTRLRRAALAVQSGADMTTASATAGFSDSAHFSRVFRATFGLAPSEVLPILEIADLRE